MRIQQNEYDVANITGAAQAILMRFDDRDLNEMIALGADRWPGGLEVNAALQRITESPFRMTSIIVVEHEDSNTKEQNWVLLTGWDDEFFGTSLIFQTPDVMSGISVACVLATTTYGWQKIREFLQG